LGTRKRAPFLAGEGTAPADNRSTSDEIGWAPDSTRLDEAVPMGAASLSL